MLVCRNAVWFGFLDLCWTDYLESRVMDINKEREAFEAVTNIYHCIYNADLNYYFSGSQFVGNKAEIAVNAGWKAWQAAKAQAVPDQLDVNSILHDIDCYFDNGLSNTERTANNLLQSIYEKLSGEVKAQEPAND